MWSFVPRAWNDWTTFQAENAPMDNERHAHLLYLDRGRGLLVMHTDTAPVLLEDGRIVMQLPDNVRPQTGGGERDLVVLTRACIPAWWVVHQLDKLYANRVTWWNPAEAPPNPQ